MSILKRIAVFLKTTPPKDIFKRLVKRHKAIKYARDIREEKMAEIKQLETEKGVDFGGYIPDVKELGLTEGQCNGYEPSYEMPEIFSYLNITAEDKLLDLGCGKGYAMYLFSQFPFSQIDGVELSKPLCEICNNNLDKLFTDSRERFTVFNENALDFDKLDDYNYIYMYNPFPVEIMPQVANMLIESAKRREGKLTVIYQNACKGSLIEADGTFERIMMVKGTALYESRKER